MKLDEVKLMTRDEAIIWFECMAALAKWHVDRENPRARVFYKWYQSILDGRK